MLRGTGRVGHGVPGQRPGSRDGGARVRTPGPRLSETGEARPLGEAADASRWLWADQGPMSRFGTVPVLIKDTKGVGSKAYGAALLAFLPVALLLLCKQA